MALVIHLDWKTIPALAFVYLVFIYIQSGFTFNQLHHGSTYIKHMPFFPMFTNNSSSSLTSSECPPCPDDCPSFNISSPSSSTASTASLLSTKPLTAQEKEPLIFQFSASRFKDNPIFETTIQFPCYPATPPDRIFMINPAIIRYKGHMYIAIREWWSFLTPDRGYHITSTMAFGKVHFYNNSFQVGCQMMRYAVPSAVSVLGQRKYYGCEDPRLFIMGGKLMWTYNCAGKLKHIYRQQYLSELYFDSSIDLYYNPPFSPRGGGVVVRDERLIQLPAPYGDDRVQKNMVPFVYNDVLYVAYSIEPHRIFRLDNKGNATQVHVTWYAGWGQNLIHHPHGGSHAILITKRMSKHTSAPYYLSLCHTRTKENIYYTYAYKFTSKPPFNVIGVTAEIELKREPSVHYKETIVAFASGLELLKIEGQYIVFITYGSGDSKSLVWSTPLKHFETLFF